MIVYGQRQRIVDEVDGSATENADAMVEGNLDDNDEDLREAQAKRVVGPSQEAKDRFNDYRVYASGLF
jgi:hypothetical protein